MNDGGKLSFLSAIVSKVAELLPRQGPLDSFVYRNPVEGYEALPFVEACRKIQADYRTKLWWPIERYRQLRSEGRIKERFLRQRLEQFIAATQNSTAAGYETTESASMRPVESRRLEKAKDPLFTQLPAKEERYYALLCSGIDEADGDGLKWLLSETPALSKSRAEAHPFFRSSLSTSKVGNESKALAQWWKRTGEGSLMQKIEGLAKSKLNPIQFTRHRDYLKLRYEWDTDDAVNSVLIHFFAAFTDQGLAQTRISGRALGMHDLFCEIHDNPIFSSSFPWSRELRNLIITDKEESFSALESISNSLTALDVPKSHHESYLLSIGIALKGWAALVRELELRPDRARSQSGKVHFDEFLAIRLLVERAVLSYASQRFSEDLHSFEQLGKLFRSINCPKPPILECRFQLFQYLQLLPLSIDELSDESLCELVKDLELLTTNIQQEIYQLAYEESIRTGLLTAIAHQANELWTGDEANNEPFLPSVQITFCIDDREESLRRHIEAVMPTAKTYGTAGNYGLAIYYQGPNDAAPRAHAPAVQEPNHFVGSSKSTLKLKRENSLRQRFLSSWRNSAHSKFGDSSLITSTISALLGPLHFLPTLTRIARPDWFHSEYPDPEHSAKADIHYQYSAEKPSRGKQYGFTLEEQCQIVRTVLDGLGLRDSKLSDLVIITAHASDSRNNPHRSGYDCGACGGAPGGINARIFAKFANDIQVRDALRNDGFLIPERTYFVAAEHNTAADIVEYFDTDMIPESHENKFHEFLVQMNEALRQNAFERCRRFVTPQYSDPEDYHYHVRTRRQDLTQARAEYDHATNAFCIVGSRALTRHVFLDRRAFLQSYDYRDDTDDGVLIEKLSSILFPVCMGINLSYYFGSLQPEVFGSGTKLPHNVVGLVGVMNGTESDLQTGVWRQTSEIHEPIRMTYIFECPERIWTTVLARNESFNMWIKNEWCFVILIDPETKLVHQRKDGIEIKTPFNSFPPTQEIYTWHEHFKHKSHHLDFAIISNRN